MEGEQRINASEEMQQESQETEPTPTSMVTPEETEQLDLSVVDVDLASEKPKRRRGKTLLQGHVHHWKIEEADGPTSMGRCGCGSEKQFKNWLSDSDFITNEEQRMIRATDI